MASVRKESRKHRIWKKRKLLGKYQTHVGKEQASKYHASIMKVQGKYWERNGKVPGKYWQKY